MQTVGTPLLWTGFTVLVLALLAIDLGVFHRKSHEVHHKEALTWTGVWIAISLLFNAWVWYEFGHTKGMEFLTAYLIEKALSVDNIFVFVVILSTFAVPKEQQHRVLFWGVLGALIMRAIFIVAGAALIQRFHWVMYIFGALLIVTGIRLFKSQEEEPHPERSPAFRLARRFIPSVSTYHDGKFFIVENGRRLATPLLIVLIGVEFTDVIFAVDSIPAIFAITNDPFIIYTSNVFAILGLRALYFVLAGFMDKFRFLNIGLAFVLIFVGIKMLIVDFYKVPIGMSLAVIATFLAVSIIVSLLRVENEEEPEDPDAA